MVLKLVTCRPAVGQSARLIPRGLQSTQAGLGCPDSCGLSRAVPVPGEGASDFMGFLRAVIERPSHTVAQFTTSRASEQHKH